MLVQIWHERSCQKRFDVFYGNKKLKGGEEYPLPREKLQLQFIERNPMMSKFWFLRALACFFAGLISGTFSDFKDIPRTRTQIDVLLLNAGEDLDITFTGDGYRIDGAETEELSRSETALPQVERRIKAYKAIVLAIAAAAVTGALIALSLALL